MNYLAVLGRQPEISIAELQAQFGQVQPLGRKLALFSSPEPPDLARLGGVLKIAQALPTPPPDARTAPSPAQNPPDSHKISSASPPTPPDSHQPPSASPQNPPTPSPDSRATQPSPTSSKSLPPALLAFLLSAAPGHKLVLGLSDYTPAARRATVQRLALQLKKDLTKSGRSVRILNNDKPVLSTATVLYNHLGKKPGHFELIKFQNHWYLGLAVQDINAYARRDQARPCRSARVGMLPPKLAQILINLCGPLAPGSRILDPFCGTGVVLQEAALAGYIPYGSDISEKMVEYSRKNLKWLGEKLKNDNNFNFLANFNQAQSAIFDQKTLKNDNHINFNQSQADKNSKNLDKIDKFVQIYTLSNLSQAQIDLASATNHVWAPPIAAVACECYLGSPLSSPPSELKLRTEKQQCKTLVLDFLKNIYPQINPGTPLCLAIPAWLRPDGHYARLFDPLDGRSVQSKNTEFPKNSKLSALPQLTASLAQPKPKNSPKNSKNPLDEIAQMGYNVIKYGVAQDRPLLYYREGQIVAREIIVLRKK